MFQNNETAAILVFQTNPEGAGPFCYAKIFFGSHKFAEIVANVSENSL